MVEALALFHAVRGDLAFLEASEMRALTGDERERVVGLRNDVQYALDEQARLCLEAGGFRCRTRTRLTVPSPPCARRCPAGSGPMARLIRGRSPGSTPDTHWL